MLPINRHKTVINMEQGLLHLQRTGAILVLQRYLAKKKKPTTTKNPTPWYAVHGSRKNDGQRVGPFMKSNSSLRKSRYSETSPVTRYQPPCSDEDPVVLVGIFSTGSVKGFGICLNTILLQATLWMLQYLMYCKPDWNMKCEMVLKVEDSLKSTQNWYIWIDCKKGTVILNHF